MLERYSTFTALITEINRAIHKIKTKEMEEFELKSTHVSCIYYLYKNGELTSGALCEYCKEDKASISRSVLYLQKHGYLKRSEVEGKHYNAPLMLTEKGNAIGERMREKISGVLSVSDCGITAEDKEKMYKSLEAINQNLQEYCKKYDE